MMTALLDMKRRLNHSDVCVLQKTCCRLHTSLVARSRLSTREWSSMWVGVSSQQQSGKPQASLARG